MHIGEQHRLEEMIMSEIVFIIQFQVFLCLLGSKGSVKKEPIVFKLKLTAADSFSLQVLKLNLVKNLLKGLTEAYTIIGGKEQRIWIALET